jgi:hypothetical protein
VLAANKSEYDARRDADLSERKATRRARGIAEGDSRRVDRGILTYDERLQAAQPGLGIAREQAGAMRDVAGIQAGVAGRGIDAQERMATARNALDQAIASGNQKSIRENARLLAETQREIAKDTNVTNMGIAGLTTEAQVKRAEAEAEQSKRSFGLEERRFGLEEQQTLLQSADSYQREADAYYDQGQFQKAERAQAQADAYRSQLPQSGRGIVPNEPSANASRSLPPEIREQLKSMDPRAIVEDLRRRGMSDEEINKELAMMFGQGRVLGMTTGTYPRTASDPYGQGWASVDPSTGFEGRTILGQIFDNEWGEQQRPGLQQRVR